ncbi:MAG: hypothetical protein ACXWDO_03645 [Bacteroidia bacterium]
MYYLYLFKSYCFFFLLILSLGSCANGKKSDATENGQTAAENAADPDSKPTYSDSLLIADEKPSDTVDYSEEKSKESEEDFSLPEEKSFEQFYNQVAAALNKGNASAINKFIHPKWGIYIIDRPGAIDKVDTGKNIQAFYKKIYLGNKRLIGMDCKLEHRPIPEITCDKAYEGCLAEITDNFHRITDLKKGLQEYGFKDNYLPKDAKSLSAFEMLVKRNTVNFDKAIGISFLYIDGKWYIGVIDLAKYSCSA